MPACPTCHGHGHHDLRDDDAILGELWSDEQISNARAAGMIHPVGIVPCDECESTGVVSEARRADLLAVALAHVEQVIARVEEENRAAQASPRSDI